AHEHDRLVVRRWLLHVGVDEPFRVKLPEHEQLSRRVVADHAQVMVDLAVLVLLLRWIGRRVRFLQKPTVEDKLVGALGRASPGLAGLIAPPGSGEETQRRETIRLGYAFLAARGCAEQDDHEQDGDVSDIHRRLTVLLREQSGVCTGRLTSGAEWFPHTGPPF